MKTPQDITIRRTAATDRESLVRLAELDSKHLPTGTFLIAEIDGEPRAAISLDSGEVFANPFRPTANVAKLLRLRAARIREIEGTEPARKRGVARVAASAARLLPGHRRRATAASGA